MLNRCTILGYLGQDPELRTTQNGTSVVSMSVATTDKWKDKATGEMQENTEWHRIVCWGKQGETCNQYLTKGSQVYLEGRLQTRQWEDKDGVTRYTTEIVASRVLFTGKGGGSGQSSGSRPPHPADGGSGESTTAPATKPVDDSDFPF
jgi:single-strand DNA-binding protein